MENNIQYQRIHLVGANGVGLSAVGKLFLQKGAKVSGSDLSGGIFFKELEKIGADLCLGHKASNLPDVDLAL